MPILVTRKRKKREVALSIRGGVLLAFIGLLSLLVFFDARRSPTPLGGHQPSLVVVVRETGGGVVFEPHEATGWFSARPGELRAVSSLLVYSNREAVWQVEAATPTYVTVTYGRVPHDFVQMVPGSGAPPPLLPEQEYVVAVRGAAGVGSTGFRVSRAPGPSG